MNKCLLFILLFPAITYAGTSSCDREILNIGCHRVSHTCFATISRTPVGPGTCSSNSIRWHSENDFNGKIALAHLTTAFVAGKKVSFHVSDICYTYQSQFPTFNWWIVK